MRGPLPCLSLSLGGEGLGEGASSRATVPPRLPPAEAAPSGSGRTFVRDPRHPLHSSPLTFDSSPPTGGRGDVRGASNPSPFSLGGEDLPFFLSPQWGERVWVRGAPSPSPPSREGERDLGGEATGFTPSPPLTFYSSPPAGGRGKVRGASNPSPLRGEGRVRGLFFPSPPWGRGQGEGGATLPFPSLKGGGRKEAPSREGKNDSGLRAGHPLPSLSPLTFCSSPPAGGRGRVRGSHPPLPPPSREGEKDSGGEATGFTPSPPTGERQGEGGQGLGEGGATLPAPLPQGRGKKTRGRGSG